jgi:putative oxidoreductase
MLKKMLESPDDLIATFTRVMFGVVFCPHGAQKLLGWFGGGGFHLTVAQFEQVGIPPFLTFLVIIFEFFGPLALTVGFVTRLAAMGIAFDMVLAVLMVHFHIGFFMNRTGRQIGEGFEYHLLVIVIAIPLVIRGAGALSVDRLIARYVVWNPNRASEPPPTTDWRKLSYLRFVPTRCALWPFQVGDRA